MEKKRSSNVALVTAIIIVVAAITSIIIYIVATRIDVPAQKHEIRQKPAPATEQSRASVSADEQPVQSPSR